jgi:hypothetical protein
MNIFTSEVEMLRADNEDLQKTLAKLFWDYTILERAFNDATGAKWVRKSDHPQRTWVGLTEEEISAFDLDPVEANAMIAKLKEKNT